MPKELVIQKNNKTFTTSKLVSWRFDKRHDHVLRDICNIKEKVSPQFWGVNFIETSYKSRGKSHPMYYLTKDGFTMLVMGYTGEEAMRFKEVYINRFNYMERYIVSQKMSKMEFPALTDNIKIMHEEPKHYHYSNECNMINKIVLGMTAKKFKEENNIPKKEQSIRNYLAEDQIYYIEKLQHADVGMVVAIPDYYERQKALKNYYNMLRKERCDTNNMLEVEVDG